MDWHLNEFALCSSCAHIFMNIQALKLFSPECLQKQMFASCSSICGYFILHLNCLSQCEERVPKTLHPSTDISKDLTAPFMTRTVPAHETTVCECAQRKFKVISAPRHEILEQPNFSRNCASGKKGKKFKNDKNQGILSCF